MIDLDIDPEKFVLPEDRFPTRTCKGCGEEGYDHGRFIDGEWYYHCAACGHSDARHAQLDMFGIL